MRFAPGFLAAALVMVSACAPAQPSPPAAPPKPAATSPSKADQAAPPAASPVAKPAEKPAPKPSAEWEQTVAAAKGEGRVVVIGGPGDGVREGMTQGFQRKYPEIQVEFSGVVGSQIAPRVLAEVSSGQRVTDIVVTGTTTIIESLLGANALERIPPFLVGPETQDLTVWRGGKFSFADEAGQYNMVISAYAKGPFVYNTTVVNPSQFTSWKDLLQPNWKGKIAMVDPRLAGGGLATATFWYAAPALGKEFIQSFFANDVTIATDNRQLLDWVARGQYPIEIGAGDLETVEAIRRQLPIKYLEPTALREGAYVTAGGGSMAILANPPHPNATKVYLDYLLSQQGQLEYSRGGGFPSMRRDVPTDHILDVLVPKDGVQYQDNHSERYVRMRGEIIEFLNTVLPR